MLLIRILLIQNDGSFLTLEIVLWQNNQLKKHVCTWVSGLSSFYAFVHHFSCEMIRFPTVKDQILAHWVTEQQTGSSFTACGLRCHHCVLLLPFFLYFHHFETGFVNFCSPACSHPVLCSANNDSAKNVKITFRNDLLTDESTHCLVGSLKHQCQ